MTQWHPIETAPHGQMLLGFADGMIRLVMIEDGKWVTVGADFSPYWFEPSYWMPLPDPPDPRPSQDDEDDGA